MTGLAFPEHWSYAGEWWALNAYRPNEGYATVGFHITGEHIEEFDVMELGHRTAAHLATESDPYPGWYPG